MSDKFGTVPGSDSELRCPVTSFGNRKIKTLNLTAIDLDGTPAASTGACEFYGYVGVNTGMQVRVVRISAQNVATAKGGTASTEPVVAVYKAATTLLASCSSMTLTLSASGPIGYVWEGSDDSTGLLFGASDRLAASLYTASVAAANSQGNVHLTIEYIDGPLA